MSTRSPGEGCEGIGGPVYRPPSAHRPALHSRAWLGSDAGARAEGAGLSRGRRLLGCAALLGGLAASGGAPVAPAAALTGVCPDGSLFVVSEASQVPCRGARLIEPDETPPLRPEYLPRPYTWQIYHEKQNPNNAYNLLEEADRVRALRDGKTPPAPRPGATGAAGGRAGASRGSGGGPPAVSAPPPRAARQHRSGPVDLGLTSGELRDLFLIVELSQDDAPARFLRQSAAGAEELALQLAHSEAFQGRFADAWRGHGPDGKVVLFSAVARRAGPFYANFTFVQGHLAFQPKVDDPEQFGLLQGRLGPLDGEEVALGYVVLPSRMDLSEPMDVYWNDRRIEALFRP